MHNPAPGRRGRIRFVCVSRRLDSRGYLLAIDQLGIDPAPPSPPGWNEFESAAILRRDSNASADLMSLGRDDFFGWGGRVLAARGRASVVVSLLEAFAGSGTGGVELRGIVESGDWAAQIDGAKPQPIVPKKKAKQPSLWRLRFSKAQHPPVVLTLTLNCRSAKGGRLMLDAWRTGEAAESTGTDPSR